jgi:hypothetical protein
MIVQFVFYAALVVLIALGAYVFLKGMRGD